MPVGYAYDDRCHCAVPLLDIPVKVQASGQKLPFRGKMR
jgi:hypothetical protein